MEHEQNRGKHLNTEQLLDYLEDRLSPDEIQAVEEHLASDCQNCQTELNWIQETIDLMGSYVWIDPPAHSSAAARRLFRQQRQRTRFSFTEWLNSFSFQPRSLATAATIAVILIITTGILFWSTQSQNPVVGVANLEGDVELQRPESETWDPVTEQVELPAGSSLRTGNNSTVVLSFPDESKVLVEPDTELSILRMNVDDGTPRDIVLRQDRGSTHNLIKTATSLASRFEIQTPAAVINVIGTEFIVKVDRSGKTEVSVSEGKVSVSAQGATVMVDSGHSITVVPGQAPNNAVAAPVRPRPNQFEEAEEQETVAETAVPSPTDTPTAEEVQEQEEEQTATITSTPSKTPTVKPSSTPTSSATPTATATPSPTQSSGGGPDPTNTPSSPQPMPTETEMPSPTPMPTETPKDKTPPGQTKTPEPPGRTRTPSSSNANASN